MDPQNRQQTLFQVFNEISIVQQLIATEFNRSLPDGIHVSHFGVINHLFRLGNSSTPAEIARAFQVTKPTMTHTLKVLSSRGFVELRDHPKDRRSKQVFLTDKGKAFRETALQSLKPRLGEIDANLDIAELAQMLPHLRKLRAFLDQTRNG